MKHLRSALLSKPWSAQAFDRILLLLILAAPQVVMIAWLVTNGLGVVERALWLEPAPLATRLIGTGIWIVAITVTALAVTKRGKFIWLWLIAVAVPLYLLAFAPSPPDALSVTPFLPLAGLSASVGIFSMAEWLCSVVLLLLQLALNRFGLWVDLLEENLDQLSNRGSVHLALTTEGAGVGVFVAIVAWSVSVAAPNVLPGGLLSVVGVTVAVVFVFSVLRRLRLTPLVFALLCVAPYVAALNSRMIGFWPAGPQPVFVHLALMILIAAPFVWLGYGISARIATLLRSRFTPLICMAIALVIGVAIYVIFAIFVNVIPALVGITLSPPRLETAREIWLKGWWSWGVAMVAAFIVFVGYWCPKRSNSAAKAAAQVAI